MIQLTQCGIIGIRNTLVPVDCNWIVKMWILKSVLVLAVAPLLIFRLIDVLTAKKYPIHSSGIVLITGASSGIGKHAAEYVAQKHPSLVVLAATRKVSDASLIAELKIPNLRPIILDVADHESCLRAFDEIKELMAELKIPFAALVNNAGVGRTIPIEYHTVDDAKAVFNTNFFGILDLLQLAIPLLRESKGRIIMVSSIAGIVARPLSSIYSASKFALEGFSDSLRREMIPFEVSVSVVQPAFVSTAIFEKGIQSSMDVFHNIRQQFPNNSMAQYYENYIRESAEKKKAMTAKASDPIVTSVAIEDAIVNPFPKTRYPVANVGGVSANAIVWIVWLVGDRIKDLVLLKAF